MFSRGTEPSTSALGILVAMPHACPCGGGAAVIGSSCGPHHGRLICATCGRWRGWASAATFACIADVIDTAGRPTEPIVVRRSRREGV